MATNSSQSSLVQLHVIGRGDSASKEQRRPRADADFKHYTGNARTAPPGDDCACVHNLHFPRRLDRHCGQKLAEKAWSGYCKSPTKGLRTAGPYFLLIFFPHHGRRDCSEIGFSFSNAEELKWTNQYINIQNTESTLTDLFSRSFSNLCLFHDSFSVQTVKVSLNIEPDCLSVCENKYVLTGS